MDGRMVIKGGNGNSRDLREQPVVWKGVGGYSMKLKGV